MVAVELLGDAGDACAGGFGVGREGDAADEAEVDYVAGEGGVVAVAEGGADVGFGEHCWFDDIGWGPLPVKSVQSLRFRDFRFGLGVGWVWVAGLRWGFAVLFCQAICGVAGEIQGSFTAFRMTA